MAVVIRGSTLCCNSLSIEPVLMTASSASLPVSSRGRKDRKRSKEPKYSTSDGSQYCCSWFNIALSSFSSTGRLRRRDALMQDVARNPCIAPSRSSRRLDTSLVQSGFVTLCRFFRGARFPSIVWGAGDRNRVECFLRQHATQRATPKQHVYHQPNTLQIYVMAVPTWLSICC